MIKTEKKTLPSLYSYTLDEISELLTDEGFEKYRAKQVYQFLYHKDVNDFDEMTNLPKKLIDFLKAKMSLLPLSLVQVELSERKDTQKYLFKLFDDSLIESVLIKDGPRKTLCISSQVGCSLNCKFCATGQMGIKRNLYAGEIIAQFLYIRRKHENIDNIVFMGMGEPLLNYNNVIKSIRLLNSKDGLNFGMKRITLSTSGVIKGIRRLANEDLNLHLAVSLNAATQELRSQIMPFSRKQILKALIEACKFYQEKTGKRITFEYILLKDINMARSDAKKIIALNADLKFNLNLIPYNPIVGSEYQSPTPPEVERFTGFFQFSKIEVVQRKRKGRDISAACGQLATSTTTNDQQTRK